MLISSPGIMPGPGVIFANTIKPGAITINTVVCAERWSNDLQGMLLDYYHPGVSDIPCTSSPNT
jgi:hypothetical protein